MSGFLKILVAVFIALLIFQQSNVVEKTKIFDITLGVYRDEYHMNWQNLRDYVIALPQNIVDFFRSIPVRLHRKR